MKIPCPYEYNYSGNRGDGYMEPIHFQMFHNSSWFKLLSVQEFNGFIAVKMSLTGLTFEQGRSVMNSAVSSQMHIHQFFHHLYGKERWENAQRNPRAEEQGWYPCMSTWHEYNTDVKIEDFMYLKCYPALRKSHPQYDLKDDTTAFIEVRFNKPPSFNVNKLKFVPVDL